MLGVAIHYAKALAVIITTSGGSKAEDTEHTVICRAPVALCTNL